VTCPAGRLLKPDATAAGWLGDGATAPPGEFDFVDAGETVA